MNTTITQKNSVLLTQEWTGDEAPSAAILIEPYTDCVSIVQESSSISLNYHHIDELCKILKSMKNSRP